ncbi:MAG: DUF5103 domain-containing protein [Cyclobacteriaceae bacterium]|nr:DUF5103 domain-containing protein [Cyclobacteriaceae bacterium]
MRFALLILLLIPFSGWCQKELVLQDQIYEQQIKSVQCYLNTNTPGSYLLPAVASIGRQNLMLEFDDLAENRNNYYIRLIHCNFDWSKSTLMDLDFMRDYNEQIINDYAFSLNTHVPYVHYRMPIPPVKLPGNYVVIIYRDGDKKDLILSRRISIFEPRFDLAQDETISGLGNIRNTNQPLNFVINYGRTEVINPMGSIHVVVRQNQRWDNAKVDVKPSFLREDKSQMEFRFFDVDKTFEGGNEFRFVDFRSLLYPGQNTMKLDKARKPYDLFVNPDMPRGSQSYTQYPDMNGNFDPDNKDYQQEPWISGNYLYVNFGLKSPQLKGNVYVIGAFNGWARNDENRMQYKDGFYTSRMLLKQGFYNYQYFVDSSDKNPNQVEGNYFQTENVYEVFVYYRPFQPNADLLVGYYAIPFNAR